MKVDSSQAWSLISGQTFWPSTSAWKRSGYCVAEWLPQITILRTAATGLPILAATCDSARLWSRRIMPVNCRGLRPGALFIAMSAFVLAGLPTTSTRTLRLAAASRARPWTVKICAFASSRSLRSIPFERGRAPTSSATSASRKAIFGSSDVTMPARSGNAQSSSSITTPFSAGSACVISRSCRITGWSLPSMSPAAIRNSRL